MLKPKSPQESFYGSYLYDRIVPVDHLLRKINQVVDPVSSTGQAFLLQGKYLRTGTTRISAGQQKTRSSCSGCAYYNIFTEIPIDRWWKMPG
ncbi:MAG: hypothetical protein NTW48_08810 [Chloroflexi bacterium]|nr:hypothetical protein [Chloroflexota bacterium]